MVSRYVKQLKQKYTVRLYGSVYCTSQCDYFAKAIIISKDGRETREIDLNGCRVMWHNKPFTYKGYPRYVQRSIAGQLKQMLDEGELSVYEYDRDGNRRYHDLRYHEPAHLTYVIDLNFKVYGSGV